jgi:hypothetical protein
MNIIQRIYCIDKIVRHEPRNAMQHKEVERYIVNYIGFPQEFELDPKFFYDKIAIAVKTYWKKTYTHDQHTS